MNIGSYRVPAKLLHEYIAIFVAEASGGKLDCHVLIYNLPRKDYIDLIKDGTPGPDTTSGEYGHLGLFDNFADAKKFAEYRYGKQEDVKLHNVYNQGPTKETPTGLLIYRIIE